MISNLLLYKYKTVLIDNSENKSHYLTSIKLPLFVYNVVLFKEFVALYFFLELSNKLLKKESINFFWYYHRNPIMFYVVRR